jgi:hypothetical protein
MAVLVAVTTSSGVGAGTISATGSLTATSFVSRSGSGPISATASIEGAGLDDPTPAGAGAVSATGALTATGRPVYQGSGPIDAAGTLTATGDTLANTGSGSVSAVGAMTSGGRRQPVGSGPVSATGTLAAAGGSSPRQGSGSVSAAGALDGNGIAPTVSSGPLDPRRVVFRLDNRFTTDGPSPASESEIASRLVRYVDDLQSMYAKTTDIQFTYNPATDCTFHDHTDTDIFPPNFPSQPFPPGSDWFFEAKVLQNASALTSASSGSVGQGRVGPNSYGFLGANWLAIWSEAETDSFDLVPSGFGGITRSNDYCFQLYHLTHEFGHTFGLGVGEYYSCNDIRDFTGVEPDLTCHANAQTGYWSDRANVTADVMCLANTTPPGGIQREDWLDQEQFCELSSFVLNEVADGEHVEGGVNYPLYNQPSGDFEVIVEVLRSSNQTPIVGATVDMFKSDTSFFHPFFFSSTPHQTAVTDSSGRASLTFAVGDFFVGNNMMRMFKASAPGFANNGDLVSVWDLNAYIILATRGSADEWHYSGSLTLELDAA